jgi:hypothetical protein
MKSTISRKRGRKVVGDVKLSEVKRREGNLK